MFLRSDAPRGLWSPHPLNQLIVILVIRAHFDGSQYTMKGTAVCLLLYGSLAGIYLVHIIIMPMSYCALRDRTALINERDRTALINA